MRSKRSNRKIIAKAFDQKRFKEALVRRARRKRVFEEELDQITFGMNNLKLHSQNAAPLSHMSLLKVAFISSIERQIAVSLKQDSLPSIRQLVEKNLVEAKESCGLYLRTHDDDLCRWQFDCILSKVLGDIMQELVDAADFEVTKVGEMFEPDFDLADDAMSHAVELCKCLEIPHAAYGVGLRPTHKI